MSNSIRYLSKFKIFLMVVLYSILLIVVFLLVDRYIFINQTKKDLLDNSISTFNKSKIYIELGYLSVLVKMTATTFTASNVIFN